MENGHWRLENVAGTAVAAKPVTDTGIETAVRNMKRTNSPVSSFDFPVSNFHFPFSIFHFPVSFLP
jgi:hypothetical protein